MEVVVASSSVDAGISCWELHSGAEQLRYRGCSSPPHGLTCVARRFLASSQLRGSSSSSSGSVFYWSWNKTQPEVKSFPVEPINPLACNSDGTYIVGGGASGDIYLWEVASGQLLKQWHGHYRSVTCLVFSDDESFLISGAEDGCVRVWSLCRLFDIMGDTMSSQPYENSFTEHTLKVTDVVCGYGGCSAIIISASEDRTCKVWSLPKGNLLRNVVFPSIIYSIALDPGENVFYAGCSDSKIYIAALNAVSATSSSYGLHIIGALSDHSKAVTCLAFSNNGISLVSGSEDGTVRVWDTKSNNVVRIFKYAKGPVNNVIIVRQPIHSNAQLLQSAPASVPRRQSSLLLAPPLNKYVDSEDENLHNKPVKVLLTPSDEYLDGRCLSFSVMTSQIKELQHQGSAAAAEMELERLRLDCKRSMQMTEKWKKMYQSIVDLSLDDLLDAAHSRDVNEKP
ncbi:protein ROOT INITIATION DEFECTIVE 3-like [Aristolochia californica]|uniref:protein ROOT INITIATION DEFECTIVE 3-like n=1 Tax=Aristolochia californica TaxID=171875 RepID=UPI0035E0EC5F